MLLKADFESNMGFLDPTIEAIMAAGEGQSLDRSQGRISDAIQVFLRSGSLTNTIVRDLALHLSIQFSSNLNLTGRGNTLALSVIRIPTVDD